MNISEENHQLTQLNEMMVHVSDHLPTEIEQTIIYNKLRTVLHSEIFDFCREKKELRDDLNFLRQMIGKPSEISEIQKYLDELKARYNEKINDIGIDYHIEVTRFDFAAAVFCVIKRTDISMKKFVFRFRKTSATEQLFGVSNAGAPEGGN